MSRMITAYVQKMGNTVLHSYTNNHIVHEKQRLNVKPHYLICYLVSTNYYIYEAVVLRQCTGSGKWPS